MFTNLYQLRITRDHFKEQKKYLKYLKFYILYNIKYKKFYYRFLFNDLNLYYEEVYNFITYMNIIDYSNEYTYIQNDENIELKVSGVNDNKKFIIFYSDDTKVIISLSEYEYSVEYTTKNVKIDITSRSINSREEFFAISKFVKDCMIKIFIDIENSN